MIASLSTQPALQKKVKKIPYYTAIRRHYELQIGRDVLKCFNTKPNTNLDTNLHN